MRQIVAVALVALLCGCICCGGKDVNIDQIKGLTDAGGGNSPQNESSYCSPPYLQVGEDCCLDQDDNGICDTDEAPSDTVTEGTGTSLPQDDGGTPTPTEETTTTTSTTVIPREPPSYTIPTTTLPNATCGDGVQNQGEEYADCGGPCTDCLVFKLDGGWTKFKESGYSFRFNGRDGMGQSLKYKVEIKTPDGITDERPLSTGESFVDYLRFKVINYGEDSPKVYMRVNSEDLSKIPAEATLMSIGGLSCFQKGASEMCERNYAGYKIRMMSRVENGVKLQITPPGEDMTPERVEITGSARAYSGDQQIALGGFFDKTHFIQGGYSLVYVFER